jgi:hypothetical protein
LVGDESQYLAVALVGFVLAVISFAGSAVLAARRTGLQRFTSGVALGIAGFIATIVAAFLTYRTPAGGPRIGEAIVPLTWGIAWGFYAFAVLLPGVVLTAPRRPKVV